MFRRRAWTTAALLVLGAAASAGTAFSQAPDPSVTAPGINFDGVLTALLDQLWALIGVVATYLINRNVKNQQMATMLSNAVQNGLGIIQQRTASAIKSGKHDASTGSPDIDAGVRYVLNNAEEAIRHFKVPQERIAQKLEAKLGLAEIATNLATTASPAPVIAGPLAPTPTTSRVSAAG